MRLIRQTRLVRQTGPFRQIDPVQIVVVPQRDTSSKKRSTLRLMSSAIDSPVRREACCRASLCSLVSWIWVRIILGPTKSVYLTKRLFVRVRRT